MCCRTGHSCWCPAQSASDPVQTERCPGCCLWQPFVAGWSLPHVLIPQPTLHLECSAVPGTATRQGLPWNRWKEEWSCRSTAWVSYVFLLFNQLVELLHMHQTVPTQLTVKAFQQLNTHMSCSLHFPAQCLRSWMTHCPETQRQEQHVGPTWNKITN